MRRRWFGAGLVAVVAAVGVFAALRATPAGAADARGAGCRGLPSAKQLRAWMNEVSDSTIGGLFAGERMWAAVVNRAGEVCSYTTSTENPTDVWPGSQAIAKSKAYTANAFSIDALALSTARLYTFTQPGHSLWSLGQSNGFNPQFLLPPTGGHDRGQISGGLIFFGGGVALYRDGQVIGGLGLSGDTSCADHEMAKRVRSAASLDPPGGALVDDIVYSPPDPASVFAHPQCVNTWRNGVQLGSETPESY